MESGNALPLRRRRARANGGGGKANPNKPRAGLAVAAALYLLIDLLRLRSPTWHERLQPVLWVFLAIAAIVRTPFYTFWSREIRAAPAFLAAIVVMLAALLTEAISVRFVTAVLGLDWHRSASPLPDTGQWLLLALNEKLPAVVTDILRTPIIGLHHYLMLFIMLGFSVLFGSIKAPGLGLAARYMFTMAIGRLLRAITFVSTILPSLRPWCAATKFQIPLHPHPWAQNFYMPYARDSDALRTLIRTDTRYVLLLLKQVLKSILVNTARLGKMSFLIDLLRPLPVVRSSWYQLLKKAEGGCNDLLYSGHMLVAVLTAMAWTEAYGGWSSAAIWLLVLHSAQREIREHHHYSVDVVVAIYVGILLWRLTGFIWSSKDKAQARRLAKLEEVQSRLIHAAKDSDIDEIRDLLKEVELAGQERQNSQWVILLFASVAIVFTLGCVLLAFILTRDG